MMNGYGTFLRINSRSEFLGGAEKKTDTPGVYFVEQLLACVVAVRFLNELYLPFGDIMVFHQLAFYLAVDIPLVRFICAEVRKNELCAFLVEVFVIILRNFGRTMGVIL